MGDNMTKNGSALEGEHMSDEDIKVLQKVLQIEGFNKLFKTSKAPMIIFIVLCFVFVITEVATVYFANKVIREMYREYVRNTEEIIKTKSDIELANSWERLPINQRKERLREQYFEIIRYYTNNITPEQKINDDQIQSTFNVVFDCTTRVPSINFFLPVAYMKVATNFNPIYDREYKKGISAFYLKTGQTVANLPLVRTDTAFQTVFKGLETLNNPNEAIKLLVARIDDLMVTFSGRADWVLLSLFTNEYDVISKYWDGGNGKIPDNLYSDGDLADSLMYFQSFKNWQIPSISAK
jgi:hypothetical protein